MAVNNANYREMVQKALQNLDSGAKFGEVKNYIFTNYQVKRGFASWVEHILKQMVTKGEVKQDESSGYCLSKISSPPKKTTLEVAGMRRRRRRRRGTKRRSRSRRRRRRRRRRSSRSKSRRGRSRRRRTKSRRRRRKRRSASYIKRMRARRAGRRRKRYSRRGRRSGRRRYRKRRSLRRRYGKRRGRCCSKKDASQEITKKIKQSKKKWERLFDYLRLQHEMFVWLMVWCSFLIDNECLMLK